MTSGARQALDLAARVLIDPGDPVWVEDPGYRPTSAVLRAAGAKLVPVPIDENGLSLAAGCKLEPRPRLICISPSHQYPLGITMSLGRRLALLESARETESFVLEDDYDSEFRYAGRPLAALQGLDQDGRVIYLGTFSKVMFPGVRLGYMVVPDNLLDAFLGIRTLMDAYPSSIAQAALADFIEDGHLAGHIRRMRPLYAERQASLIETMTGLGDELTLDPAEAGMHLVAKFNSRQDDRAIAGRANDLGIQAPALSSYFQGPVTKAGLVLGYAGVDTERIRKASGLLAKAVRG
jgi:GntR family transcriptional regulator/MocR family aminotransferase